MGVAKIDGYSPYRTICRASRSPAVKYATRCGYGRGSTTSRRDFVPWRFSDAGRRSASLDHRCRRPKTCTTADELMIFSITGVRPRATGRVRTAAEGLMMKPRIAEFAEMRSGSWKLRTFTFQQLC